MCDKCNKLTVAQCHLGSLPYLSKYGRVSAIFPADARIVKAALFGIHVYVWYETFDSSMHHKPVAWKALLLTTEQQLSRDDLGNMTHVESLIQPLGDGVAQIVFHLYMGKSQKPQPKFQSSEITTT